MTELKRLKVAFCAKMRLVNWDNRKFCACHLTQVNTCDLEVEIVSVFNITAIANYSIYAYVQPYSLAWILRY